MGFLRPAASGGFRRHLPAVGADSIGNADNGDQQSAEGNPGKPYF